jgi:quinol-cytochrome oxidoreductase complex cytochrome b subunit
LRDVQADQVARVTAARRWVVRVLAGLVGVLTLTGAYLFFAYEPSASQAWPGLAVEHQVPALASLARTVHRWAALLTIPISFIAAVVALTEAVVRWRGPSRRRSGAFTGPAIVVVVLVAVVTGFLLPWDQLALRAVTVGTDIRGYGEVVFGDQVRFALMGGREVSVGALRALLAVHVVVVSLALALLLWATHRDRNPDPDPDPDPDPSRTS